MRNATRRKQDIWFVSRTKDDSGMDPVYAYSKPVKKRCSVSSTSGSPIETGLGVVPTYDRYIICYDKKFRPEEGTYLYVDKTPELDEQKQLVIDENTGEPMVRPDYILQRIASTQKGVLARFGINRCSDYGQEN